MEMKHLYFKERPETLWREKERGYYKGKQVFLLESELYEGSTGMVVDEDLKVVEKYFEHSLDELEPDVFLIDDETYSEMEKARDLLCSLCYEVKCKDCQMVKLMAEAKETRGINKENRKPSKAKTTLHKRIEFSDWKRIFNQLRWNYGNIVILDVKKVHLNKQMWVHRAEYTGYSYPADFPCRSYKAALRHLRNHDEIPKGTQFILVSKFVGQDRILVKK